MADEGAPRRPSWLTIGVLAGAASVGVYVFAIGSQIGGMRHQLESHDLRLDALETHGSGPVQATAAKVEAVVTRADRILTEVLLMQQRVSDLQAVQGRQGAILDRLQGDAAGRPKPPP